MTDADKSHAAEKTQADTTKNGGNGAAARSQTRTVSHPRQVAALVLTQIDQVNAKKDELTIAIKALTDDEETSGSRARSLAPPPQPGRRSSRSCRAGA